MQIVYVALEKHTLNRAPALQILHTLRGICDAGGSVRYVTPWPVRSVRQKCLELTGRELPSRVEIVSLGSGPNLPVLSRLWPSQVWSGIRPRMLRYLRHVRNTEPEAVVYTRYRRVAAAIPKQGYPPFLFEYHEPQSLVIAEEHRTAAQGGHVSSIRSEEQLALANAAGLVTVSKSHDDEAVKLYGFHGPRWVIRNGADPSIFSVPAAERQPVAGRLLYVGALDPWKGLDLLLQAMVHVPGVELHLCGGKPGSEAWKGIVDLSGRLGISQRVVMHGLVPQHQLRRHLATAMAGVLPLNGNFSIADKYTCPLKLLEYVTAGLPVVATDLPSIREIVTHGREALLFENQNVDSLAAALSSLMRDVSLAARLSQAALQLAPSLSWRHRGERVIEACQTVLAGPARNVVAA